MTGQSDEIGETSLSDAALESLCEAFVDANRAEFMDTDFDLPILRAVERIVAQALWQAASDVEHECSSQAVPCFCGSARWLRERAALVSPSGATS